MTAHWEVPAGQRLRGLEHPLAPHSLRTHLVDDPVVKQRNGQVQLNQDQVLVIAQLRDGRVTASTPWVFGITSSLSGSAGS